MASVRELGFARGIMAGHEIDGEAMETAARMAIGAAAQELRSTKERSLAAAAEGLRQFLDNAKARANCFSFFAVALQFPASEQAFCAGGDCSPQQVQAVVAALGVPQVALGIPQPELAPALAPAPAPPTLAAARAEYTRLFVAPSPALASLYGATYHPGAAHERATVAAIYAHAGVKPALPSNEPADFLPFEFDYLNYLAQLELHALHAQDFQGARDLRAAAESFNAEHLSTPATHLGATLATHAALPFYRTLGTLLQAAPTALFVTAE